MDNKANVFLYLEFRGNILHKELIKNIWNEDGDVFFAERGEVFFQYICGKKVEQTREDDYCNIQYEVFQNLLPINDVLVTFLKRQINKIEQLTNICIDVKKKIHVCIYPEFEQYTVDFSTELLKLLQTLNMEIGITILQL